MPMIVLAQNIIPQNPTSLPGNSGTTFTNIFDFYVRVVLAVVGILAVAYLIYGGFRYITSAGNEEATESAKNIIKSAVIGLIIVIFSFVIVIVISNALLPQGAGP